MEITKMIIALKSLPRRMDNIMKGILDEQIDKEMEKSGHVMKV